MPVVSLADLTRQTAPITLRIGDAEIPATYHPQRVNSADLRAFFAIKEGMASGDGDRVLDAIDECARFLVRVIASWELVEEEGGPVVPLTEERLSQLGPLILSQLVISFMSNMRLGETSGAPSSTRSQPTRSNHSRRSSRR